MSKSAKEMFIEEGFQCTIDNDEEIFYIRKTDYREESISFEIKLKRYSIHQSSWIDNDVNGLIPMNERPENIKHSATYGHWQSTVIPEIDFKLHQAINKQIEEITGGELIC